MTLQAAEIVLRPVISEKSIDQTQRGKYAFVVHPEANKLQIKDAVEALFKVTVLEVNVLTNKPREKVRGRGRNRQRGWTAAWKKAVVTVGPNDKIEFFEGV